MYPDDAEVLANMVVFLDNDLDNLTGSGWFNRVMVRSTSGSCLLHQLVLYACTLACMLYDQADDYKAGNKPVSEPVPDLHYAIGTPRQKHESDLGVATSLQEAISLVHQKHDDECGDTCDMPCSYNQSPHT